MRLRPGLVGREVTTRKWRCDLARLRRSQAWRPRILVSQEDAVDWCRDIVLRSRHRLF